MTKSNRFSKIKVGPSTKIIHIKTKKQFEKLYGGPNVNTKPLTFHDLLSMKPGTELFDMLVDMVIASIRSTNKGKLKYLLNRKYKIQRGLFK